MLKVSPPPRKTLALGLLTAGAILLIGFHLLPLFEPISEQTTWEVWRKLARDLSRPELFAKGRLEPFWVASVFLAWGLLTLASPFVYSSLARSRLLWNLFVWPSCFGLGTMWVYFLKSNRFQDSMVESPWSSLFLAASLLLNFCGLIAIRPRVSPH